MDDEEDTNRSSYSVSYDAGDLEITGRSADVEDRLYEEPGRKLSVDETLAKYEASRIA